MPALGALLLLFVPAKQTAVLRNTALTITVFTFILACVAARLFDWTAGESVYGSNIQLKTSQTPHRWFADVYYYVGVDGLSLPLVVLTAAIGVLACLASATIEKQVKGYFFLLLLFLSAAIGTFVALDLVLFLVFYVLAMVPLFFLIANWGGARKEYAATKMLLLQLVGAVCLVLVIAGIHSHAAGVAGRPFDLIQLASSTSPFKAKSAASFGVMAFWLLIVAFGTRMPIVGAHTWLADAQVEAPTGISMLLGSILRPTGAYGLLRILLPIFSRQCVDLWWWLCLMGVGSILYGAFCALGQKDIKRVIAYWSISQMGFVLLGIGMMTPASLNGAIFLLISNALCAAMLYYVAGVLIERAHHRELERFGGLAVQMPEFMGLGTFAFLAAMGLPGLCGFVGEFMIFMGTFGAGDSHSLLMRSFGSQAFGSIMAFGIVALLATVVRAGYLLWVFQRIFFGPAKAEYNQVAALRGRERFLLIVMIILMVAMGIFPWVILDPIHATMDGFLHIFSRS